MTEPRILVGAADLERGEVELRGDDAHYLLRVLRLRTGEGFRAFTGEGAEVEMEIIETGREGLRARVVGVLDASTEPAHEVEMALAVLKGDAMTWAVQKVVEVGASRIRPVLAERVVVRGGPKEWAAKRRRWQQVSQQAARQCRRARVPEVVAPARVGELAAVVHADSARVGQDMPRRWLLLDPETAADRSVAAALAGSEAAGLVIGPEGDLTPDEKAALRDAGAVPVCLGPRVMRAETAAVVACALALQALGDLGAR